MSTSRLARRALPLSLALLAAGQQSTARADGPPGHGFQLDRYEPTAAGEWLFTVETPWYSRTRFFAAGLTIDYAHDPLVLHSSTMGTTTPVVTGQWVAHVDVAGSFWDHLLLSASLPVTLSESGSGEFDVGPTGAAVGDVRLGAMLRLAGQADRGGGSLHLGANVWAPIGAATSLAGDAGVRVEPKLVVAGLIRDHVRYSVNASYLYRGAASLSSLVMAGAAGQEVRLGLAAAWQDRAQTWSVGPELGFATQVSNGKALTSATTSFVFGIGGNYLALSQLLVGAWIGSAAGEIPGNPDFRFLFRAAWAPVRDSDGDGIPDRDDACPKVAGDKSGMRSASGCPEDADHDGVSDKIDQCPDLPAGDHPDPMRPGCPFVDDDHDGVANRDDQCPTVQAGKIPDPKRPGCPLDSDGDGVPDEIDAAPYVSAGRYPDPKHPGQPLDSDGDGVPDETDACPMVPAGPHPDPARKGCPAENVDADHDGVPDYEDQCPGEAGGMHPDPQRKGCPLPDRDGDGVPDEVDACPDKAGAPSTDPKKNGCPGLVKIEHGRIEILQPVFFATNKDIILPKSYPVLNAVASALKATPEIKKVEVQGHTDNKGNVWTNIDMSKRRAEKVRGYLIAQGLPPERVTAEGYGPSRPVKPNTTPVNRAINRRVEFHIVDPAPEQVVPTPGAGAPPAKAEPATPATGAAVEGAAPAASPTGKGKLGKGKPGKRKPGKGKGKGHRGKKR